MPAVPAAAGVEAPWLRESAGWVEAEAPIRLALKSCQRAGSEGVTEVAVNLRPDFDVIDAQGGLLGFDFCFDNPFGNIAGFGRTRIALLSVGVAIAIAAANAWSPIEVDNALICHFFEILFFRGRVGFLAEPTKGPTKG